MRRLVLAISVALVASSACGGQASTATGGRVALRLGYFLNVTHAPAILGLSDGSFARQLGSSVDLEAKTFNAGPAAVEALFANALDAAYIGPSPAINAFQKSNKEAVRVVAGAAAGGAALVVKPSITSPETLREKKLATPQRGNTQDVALRSWLADNGLETTLEGGGDVSILPQENAQTLETFKSGAIDGAWVPEPWATRLIVEGGGKILVDEATLWPAGKYTTTLLVVRTEFLKEHPDVVENLLIAHIASVAKANSDPVGSQTAVNAAIAKVTTKSLKEAVLRGAWARLTFTYDPLTATLERSARAAMRLGFLKTADITGIADLGPLNEILRSAGKKPVS